MNKCYVCKQEKSSDLMHQKLKKIQDICNKCRAIKQAEYYKRQKDAFPFENRWENIKSRCKQENIHFDISPEYLKKIWNGICPAFNVILTFEDKNIDTFAELDRKDPNLGYIEGNVQWISRKANRIKNDASLEELQKVFDWLKDWKSVEYNFTDEQIIINGISLKEREQNFKRKPRDRQTNSKLSEQDVLEIKRLLISKELSQKQIANKFGISYKNVWKIKTGKSWKHLEQK